MKREIKIKDLTLFAVAFSLIFGLIYLICAATQWTFIVSNWHEAVRFALGCGGIVAMFVSGGVVSYQIESRNPQ
jgi:hypothetical protein